MHTEITIGADPEVFVRRNGHFISGHEFPCGTKKEPRKTDHGSVQVDGMALECNVTPSKTKQEFVSNVRGVLDDLRKIVTESDKTCQLVAEPVVVFGKNYMDMLPVPVKELGCSPDYDAYTKLPNNKPDASVSFRTAAGHIHIGWTEDMNPRDMHHFDLCCSVAKQLDYFLGLPSLIWDRNLTRRQLYGQAGAFRPKSYGMEYRVLSNAWLKESKLVGYVFDQAIRGVRELFTGVNLHTRHGDMAQNIINNNRCDWKNVYPFLGKEVL